MNPLESVLVARSDLSSVVSTIGVEYGRTARVSRYPLESGRSVADHFTSHPATFVVSGIVDRNALDGNGAAEVAVELNRMMDAGVLFTLRTRVGEWPNCIITEYRSSQNFRNADALEFEVEVTQLRLGSVSSPAIDAARSSDTNARLLTDEWYRSLIDYDQSNASLRSRAGDVETGNYIYPSRQALEMDLPAKDFVQAQVRELSRQGITEPEYPAAFAARVAERRGALQWGSTDSVPLAGVDMVRLPVSEFLDDDDSMTVVLSGRRYQVDLQWNAGWRLRCSTDGWRSGDVQLHPMVPVQLGRGASHGWLLAYPLGEDAVLRASSFGRSYELIWVSDVGFLNG